MNERRRLILTAIVIVLVGVVTGLFLGGALLPSRAADQQYAEKTTTTKTMFVVTHSHDNQILHGHLVTTVITRTETTPHGYFHDFAIPMPTVSLPVHPASEIWTLIESREGLSEGAAPARRPNEIWIGSQEFIPGTIEVSVGTTITWKNVDAELHTVTSIDGLFNGSVPSGGTFSWTFTEPGIFSYYCQPHSGMAGTVIVK